MKHFFAQANVLPTIPWSTTASFLGGLFAVLAIIGTVLWVWNQAQKAFGRNPPMNEELDARDKRLRQMIFAVEKNLKDEQSRQNVLITRIEEHVADIQADRLRKWEELTEKIGEVASAVSFIRGQMEGK